jgi:uncharacterized FlaG/YvyC family protein
LADNIAKQNANNIATSNAQATAAWINSNAVRNTNAKIQQDANAQLSAIKKQQQEWYGNIYNTLNQYVDRFNTQYGASKDKYVRDAYTQLMWYKTQLWQNLVNAFAGIDWARLQKAISKK